MAIPTGIAVPPKKETPIDYGAYVSVAPRSEFYGTELQISTASATTSTGWRTYESRDRQSAQQLFYRVVTPNDGVTRYVRARHREKGFANGDWFPSTSSTAVVSFTPKALPEHLPPGVQVLFDGDGIRSTDIRPGSPGQSTTITKVIEIPAAEALPGNSTTVWTTVTGQAYIRALGSTVSQLFRFPLVLPKGVALTGISMDTFRGATSDVAKMVFYRWASSDYSVVSATTLTHAAATTGWVTTTASLSETSTDDTYEFQVTLQTPTTGVGFDARFGKATLTYLMDDYSKSI